MGLTVDLRGAVEKMGCVGVGGGAKGVGGGRRVWEGGEGWSEGCG